MRNLLAGFLTAGLVCGVSLGQEPQRVNPAIRPAQGQASQQGHPTADQQIASCVFGHCHNEIEIAKFAESKAKNDDVREFAQRMVREHTPGCEEMKKLAGTLVAGGESAGRPAAGATLDWVSIHKQIGQQCLNSTKQELSSKQGADFDQCFIGQQIGAHMHMVDGLTVLRNHASEDLRQKLDKELQMAKQHLQAAKQLGEQLKGSPAERVSRKPDGN